MPKSKSNRKKGGRQSRPSKFSDHNLSQINQHRRQGSLLRPPFAQLSNAVMSSWADDHLPEMLWAALLTASLPRLEYLECFRRIAALCRDWFVVDDRHGQDTSPSQEIRGMIDHTSLSTFNDDQFSQFIAIPLSYANGYKAILPLMLVDCLPGRAKWSKFLNKDDLSDDDWILLGDAIARTLDHQSESSTDIRWLKVLLPIISGNIRFHVSMSEQVEEIRLFPDYGDMRKVRPSIRSLEMSVRRNPPSEWIKTFWTEVMAKTNCIYHDHDEGAPQPPTPKIEPASLRTVRINVIRRFMENLSPLRSDARLDGSFGLLLYALAVVKEIAAHRLDQTITGRLTLRTLVELNITLRYLVAKDDPTLWLSYRVYGAGQAKLAFLKIQQQSNELPSFISEEVLHAIANEDIWQEYLDIDIGHWAKSNLRQLATDAGAKEIYDQYYDWTSTFSHGHWGAVRDSNFITCNNPLHRLHRIPRFPTRKLNTVMPDIAELVNQMIGTMDKLYPSNDSLQLIALLDDAVPAVANTAVIL